ncbi:MAG: VanZ family protein [Oscillospiraceae bacterium]
MKTDGGLHDKAGISVKLCILATVTTLLIIWGNSMMPSRISNATSDHITEAIGGTIISAPAAEVSGIVWLNTSLVRKLAHVTEFLTLGVTSSLLSVFLKKQFSQQLPNLLLLGLSAGVIDETIQLFNDRTSMIQDVWIDLAGFAVGILLTWAVRVIICHKDAVIE